MKKILGALIFLLSITHAEAQFYSTGTAPTSVKWKQINTSNFQIIFPEEFHQEANRVANTLEYMYDHVAKDYNILPKKISILLYNTSVFSNGFVVWAPRRMEWVTTPPQEGYAHDWLEQLAIHEFRHVVQISNLEQGITGILKIFFGEAAPGAVTGYLPLWFLEGDAVVAETSLSSTGRGRDPSFDMELRSIEMDREERYSYDQSYLGSYRYNIPNHYKYGYQMASYGKLKYGNYIWNNTLRIASHLPLLVPFQMGLKRNGAGSKVELYHSTFDSLRAVWKTSLDTSIIFPADQVQVFQNKLYTDYKYIQPFREGVFAVKTGINDIARFVSIVNSKETILHTPGQYFGSRVDVGEKYLVWVEHVPDPRWEQRSFTLTKLFDIKLQKERILIRKDRIFSPMLSPNEDRILSVHIDLKNLHSVKIYDTDQGKLLKEIIPFEGEQITHPVWLNDQEIAFILTGKKGKRIVSYDLITGNRKELFNAGYKNVNHLAASGEYLFFSYDIEAIRNIYALEFETGSVYRVTQARHGADFAGLDPDRGMLYYSEYTLDGYRPVSRQLQPATWSRLEETESYDYPWADALSEQADFNIQESEVPHEEYEISNYSHLLHGVNIHSWLPFYVDPDQLDSPTNLTIFPGVSIFSQNKLSTVEAMASYYVDGGVHHFRPVISLRRFYPVLEAEMLIASEQNLTNWVDTIPIPEKPEQNYTAKLRMYVPTRFASSKWRQQITPELSLNYHNRYYFDNTGAKVGYGYLEGRVFAYNLLKSSTRDLQPRFGQSLLLLYTYPLLRAEQFSTGFAGILSQYLPGIGKHHGIYLSLNIEQKEINKYRFPGNRIAPPRGYQSFPNYQNIKFVMEYSLPLFYPDWSIGPLAYIKRVHMKWHTDYARIQYPKRVENGYVFAEDNFLSVGIILGAEMHFLRFFMPFSPELRLSYLPGEKIFDLGFGISIDP